jgi:hypothetical protein
MSRPDQVMAAEARTRLTENAGIPGLPPFAVNRFGPIDPKQSFRQAFPANN